MNPAVTLVLGLQFIAIVFLVWDNITLGQTMRRVFREKLESDDRATKALRRLAALQSTIHSQCSPSSKSQS